MRVITFLFFHLPSFDTPRRVSTLMFLNNFPYLCPFFLWRRTCRSGRQTLPGVPASVVLNPSLQTLQVPCQVLGGPCTIRVRGPWTLAPSPLIESRIPCHPLEALITLNVISWHDRVFPNGVIANLVVISIRTGCHNVPCSPCTHRRYRRRYIPHRGSRRSRHNLVGIVSNTSML